MSARRSWYVVTCAGSISDARRRARTRAIIWVGSIYGAPRGSFAVRVLLIRTNPRGAISVVVVSVRAMSIRALLVRVCPPRTGVAGLRAGAIEAHVSGRVSGTLVRWRLAVVSNLAPYLMYSRQLMARSSRRCIWGLMRRFAKGFI